MKQDLNTWQDRHYSPYFWLVTFFGSGLVKPAPGTWGSLAGLAIGIPMVQGLSLFGFMGAIVIVSLFGTVAINRVEQISGIHDAPEIVIDEVAGMWIALLPFFYLPQSWWGLASAFLLFRLFDIVKPWPIGWLDKRVSGGFGVMIDDIVAGIFTFVGIHILVTVIA